MTSVPKPDPSLFRSRQTVQEQRVSASSSSRGSQVREGSPFHSAVNRIPVPRDEVFDAVREGHLPAGIFSDEVAVGHDHLAQDRWHGTIDLEMTLRSPLVFGEQKKCDVDNGPSTVSLPMLNGQLFVPPTMVKGMISRAYETLTASRFRVFGEHREALTYRSDPAAATNLCGGRVSRNPETGSLEVEVLDGMRCDRFAYLRDNPTKGVGNLLTSRGAVARNVEECEEVLRFLHRNIPHGGDEQIEVEITLYNPNKGKKRPIITGFYDGDKLYRFLSLPKKGRGRSFSVWGYLLRTAPEGYFSPQLFGEMSSGESDKDGPEKKYERFFFKAEEGGDALDGEMLHLTQRHIDRYLRVLNSYIKEDEILDGKGNRRLLNRAARCGANIEEGDLVFVLPKGDDEAPFSDFDILPTMVGRRAYTVPPRDIALMQSVLPLGDRDEASSADRMFGYVIQTPKSGARGGSVAYRGRLNFGVVDTSEVRISESPKLLVPLLGAKIGSARRFLTDSSGKTPDQNGANLPKSGFFVEGQYLGAAVFPVHQELIGKEGFPSSATELPPIDGLEPASDKTRLKVANWVESGSVLRCKISFSNLAEVELAALLWVLTPENLVPATERAKDPQACGYLRMGLGKPLGLGTVEVRVAQNGLRARKGGERSEQYSALTACSGCDDSMQNTDFFPILEAETLLERSWVQALQRASFGYPGELPVRYMTLNENKVNNQTESRTGKPKPGCGLSPRDLWGPMQTEPLQVPME